MIMIWMDTLQSEFISKESIQSWYFQSYEIDWFVPSTVKRLKYFIRLIYSLAPVLLPGMSGWQASIIYYQFDILFYGITVLFMQFSRYVIITKDCQYAWMVAFLYIKTVFIAMLAYSILQQMRREFPWTWCMCSLLCKVM